jgi:hypothetical protein
MEAGWDIKFDTTQVAAGTVFQAALLILFA